MVRAAPWIPLALGVLLSAGCGDDDGDGTIDAAPGPDASPAAPNIQIASLSPTTVAPGQKVMVTVTVANFTLNPMIGAPNVAGEGHYHIFLDGTGATDIYEPETAAMGDLTIPMATTAGAHTIIVSLRQNMHAPLSPPAEDSLMITVMP